MAAPADYWDEVDLKALAAGGFVNEDVMQKIWDISAIPLPFTDAIGSDTCENSYSEWVEDGLGDPDITNAVVSGADASGNDAAGGSRKGNHCQNSVKVLAVTERSQSVNVIGTADEYARQIMMRQQELRRDVEAIALTGQASVADDNNTTAGKAGGFAAQLETNVNAGNDTGGGFVTGTKLFTAITRGTKQALTFDAIRTQVESCYLNNGTPTMLMSSPKVIKLLNNFLFTAAGNTYAAQPVAEVSGSTPVDQVSQGFISVIKTDFGFTLRMVPNRIQQEFADDTDATIDSADLFLIDPQHAALAYLKNYTTKPLAKLGLSERAQVSVDWTLKVYVEKAHAAILCVDTSATVT